MDRQLRPLGLRVHLPEKEVQYALSGRRAYVFELLIQDVVGLDEESSQSDMAGSHGRREGTHDPIGPSRGADQPQA
jgi:hypothetical protein